MKCRHRGQFLFNGTPLLFMFNCLLCTLILIRKDVVSSILYSGYGYSYLFFMFKMKRERERGKKALFNCSLNDFRYFDRKNKKNREIETILILKAWFALN